MGEALACVDDPVVVDLIEKMWESTPLFQLAVGMRPRPRFDEHELSSALTLIEFDVDLNLPSQVKEVYTDAGGGASTWTVRRRWTTSASASSSPMATSAGSATSSSFSRR